MDGIALQFVLVVIFLLLSGLFSGLETGLMSIEELWLKSQARQGSTASALLLKSLKDTNKLMAVMLIGNNLVLVAAAASMNSIVNQLAPGNASFITTVVLTPFLLLFGEILPKSLFLQHRNALTLLFAYPVYLLDRMLGPLGTLATKFSQAFMWLLHLKPVTESPFVTRQDLQRILKEEPQALSFSESEKDLLERIFGLSEETVGSIMAPRKEMTICYKDDPLRVIVQRIIGSGFSAVPIYDTVTKDFIGIVHYSDVILAEDRDRPVTDVMRPIYVIPESKRAERMLIDFQRDEFDMALVVNEFGDAVGLITLEDIIEEVIGEIRDEYDDEEELLRMDEDQVFYVAGRMELRELEQRLDMELPDEFAETVGGLAMDVLQRVPQVGDTFSVCGLAFTVTEIQGRRVEEVRMVWEGYEPDTVTPYRNKPTE